MTVKEKIPVTAAGGVLFTEKEGELQVLLIFRRGVWDLPKGKKEPDESVESCARREVAEEVGCPLPDLMTELTQTYHEYEQSDARFGKTTHWYAMKTGIETGFEPEEREGIERVQWVPLEVAKTKVEFRNLVDVLEAFESWHEAR